ncbi:TlpA disulfide reductase family protein [Pedobacter nyackensis]|uniref:TlpA disulfide reductase family protein n=1 Tax=Pedobacter nyackensis TaxID=475255 RepID=UPI0029308948|nr:TlpA disulfide reductase family protein [Pedobacter nyackensis]
MKKYIAILCSLFSAQAMAQQGLTITGNFENLKDSKVYLVRRDKDKGLDTLNFTTSKNGSFVLKSRVTEPEPLYIFREGSPSFSYVFAENTNIEVSGNVDSMYVFKGIKVKGSPAHEQLMEFYKNVSEPFEREIMKAIEESREQGNAASVERLLMKTDEILSRRATAILKYLKTNPNQSNSLAYGIMNAYTNIGLEMSPASYNPVYEALSPSVKASVHGVKLRNLLTANMRTSPGVMAPDFTLPTANGKPVRLKDVVAKNKVVLLDFWASWCGPCRAENPNIVKAYEKYKDKGFAIISISLDTDRKKWLQAVEEDKVPWLQVSDLTQRAVVARDYGVRGIPHLVLIGQDGKVITSRNIRGEELHKKLESIFN